MGWLFWEEGDALRETVREMSKTDMDGVDIRRRKLERMNDRERCEPPKRPAAGHPLNLAAKRRTRK